MFSDKGQWRNGFPDFNNHTLHTCLGYNKVLLFPQAHTQLRLKKKYSNWIMSHILSHCITLLIGQGDKV